VKYPGNPNHANGTCEACGGPCAVYGCRYCPACYEAESAKDREQIRAQRQKVEKFRNGLLHPVSH
jgi:uncharacterized protein (DUF2225 family)